MAPDCGSREKWWGSQPGPGAVLLPLPSLPRHLRPRHSRDQPHKHCDKQTTPYMGAYMWAYSIAHWSEVGLDNHTTLLVSAEKDRPDVSVLFPPAVTILATCSLNPTSTLSPPVIPAHHLHPYISLVLPMCSYPLSKPLVPTLPTTVPGGQLQRSSVLSRTSVTSFKQTEGTC